MRKRFTRVLLAAVAAALWTPAQGEVLLEEKFDYPAGGLYGQGGWMQYGPKTDAPLSVEDKALSYSGYAAAERKSAKLAGLSDANDQSLYHVLPGVGGAETITSGDVYLAALINVQEAGKNVYFMSFAAGTASFPDDKRTGSEIGRLFISEGDAAGTFKLGMSKNGTNPTNTSADLALNTTHLVVMKYTFVEGVKNDVFSVWVDPSDLSAEGTPLMTQSNTADISATLGMRAIVLRQGGTSIKKAPVLNVGHVKVATTWGELFGNGGGEEPDPGPDEPGDATITASVSGIDFDATIQGNPVEKTLTVSGTGLTGDITATVSSSQFSVTPATISATEAEAGATLSVTYKATSAGEAKGTLTLSAEGAEDVIVTLQGTAQAVKTIPNSSFIINQTADNGELYRYAGTATVTYVDAAHKRVYAGDMSGALCVDFSYADMATLPLAVGDQFTGVLCMITKEQGVPYLMALSDVTKKGTGTKSPLEVSAAALQQDPESYIHRLVTLTDEVSFGDVAEGETFTSAARRGTAGDKSVTILPFAGTDLIGATVPQKATVTGIVRSLSIISLSPRSAADVEGATAPVEEPKLSVTAEQLLPDMLGHVGESVALARFTVSATDMTNATEVYITGKDRAMFSTDVTSIPAGTSTTEVTVTYTPTAIGKHTGRINFDAVPTELSTGTNFTVVAIDPNNLPNVSADTSELTPFEAAVGKTQEQTVAVTTAFCPDYGTAKIVNATGAFRINSTSLLKEGVTQLKVTFAPNQAGTFTDTIELTAPYGNTVTFKVTGTATAGSVEPGETEGDTDFTLDTTAPLTFYTQDFETDDAQNKPIHVEQWKNFAFEGTRAWWSYTEADGNKAAKATAYDFYGGTGMSNPCKMTLVSPALDFVNTESRFLTFDLKGQYLAEGMTDSFNVLYMVPDGEQILGQPLLASPLTADDNDEWRQFVVDLEGLELDDVFFVGFDLTSNRGRDNSAVFMVDNFSWGRSDVPFIRPSQTLHEYTVAPNTPVTFNYSCTGLNLTDPIKLKMVGSHAANFTLSHEELPATGGDFSVTFNTTEEGLHTGFVEMTSGSAPKSYIDIYATSDKDASGVGAVTTGEEELKLTLVGTTLTARAADSTDAVVLIEVYSADGTLAASAANVPVLSVADLEAGIYVARAASLSGKTATAKVAVK